MFIDRSNVNAPDVSYRKVDHLYLKASQGTTFVDSTLGDRRAMAHRDKVAHVGCYHFAGTGDPVAEADYFLGIIGKPKPGDLIPCVDVESGQSAEWVEAFAKHVHSKLGYLPVLYCNTSDGVALRRNRTVARMPWWRAEYGPNDGHPHPLEGGHQGAAAHQYTSVANVSGVIGATDASLVLDGKKLVVAERWQAVVTYGHDHYTYPDSKKGWRLRACTRAYKLLRKHRGRHHVTVKVENR